MAKIHIIVKSERTPTPWLETYDQVGIGDNGNILQAEDWAHQLIARFNATLRPGESPRTVVSVSVEPGDAHAWVKRTDGMSVEFRGQIVDVFFCSVCHITGKRKTLSGSVIRDSKYRAKKYEKCVIPMAL